MDHLDPGSSSTRASSGLRAGVASRRKALQTVFLTELDEEGLKRRSDQSNLCHLGVPLALEVDHRIAQLLDKFAVEVEREPSSA